MDLSRNSASSPIDCLIFDLDDTLYPLRTGISPAVKQNITDFLVEKIGYSLEKASRMKTELFITYGSTLAGLRASGYDVDADDYHSFVHGRLPYHLIQPDNQLRSLLNRIQQRKIIFTNSDRVHAKKVLERLGLEGCFEQVICFETMNPNLFGSTRTDEHPVVLKPSADAFNAALLAANIVDPRRTLFLDDNVHNIASGKAAGLRTVLIGKSVKCKGADYAVDDVHDIATAVPEIWVNEIDGDSQIIGRTRSEIEAMISTMTVGA